MALCLDVNPELNNTEGIKRQEISIQVVKIFGEENVISERTKREWTQ